MVSEHRRGAGATLVLVLAAVGAGGACEGSVAVSTTGSGGSGGSSVSSSSSTGSSTSSSTGSSISSSTGSGVGGCPATAPTAGTPCAPEGEVCTYPTDQDDLTKATCYQGTWAVASCIGPLPCVCPADVPVDGSACDPCCAEECPYTFDGCGPSAICSPDGVWGIVISTCPPAALCGGYTTPGACGSSTGCRWLVPACDGSDFTAGCFPAADCALGSACPSGQQSCLAVDTDPCWDSGCDACSGGTANICAGPG